MDGQVFLKGASAAVAAATGAFPTPAISEGIAARTLRLVPHADLANFDPIWTTAYIAHNGALLVYDMLYDIDSDLQPQRQMVDSEEVSADGLVWTFRLRPDLKFHDGEPVLATDAVASIRRWAAREPMGQMIKAVENEPSANGCRMPAWCSRRFPPHKPRNRVGWVVIPDPGTAAAVLHGGEVDWSTTCGERKPRDLGFVRSYAR